MLCRYVETDHQAAPPYIFQHARGLQGLRQVVAGMCGVLYQVFVADYFQYGQGCRACQMVTAESGAQHAFLRLYMRCDNNATDREPVAHTFGHGIDIGLYTGMIVGEKFTRTAITTLYTVGNKHGPVLIAKAAYALQEGIAGILAGLRSAIRRERARPNLLDLLKEAVTAWPQFDAPTELPRPGVSLEDTNAVNGGDLVEWFEPWRRRAAALIASTEGR